jgi:hypothetical protein
VLAVSTAAIGHYRIKSELGVDLIPGYESPLHAVFFS